MLVRMDDSNIENMNTVSILLHTQKIRIQKHGDLYSGFIKGVTTNNEVVFGFLAVSTDDDFRFSTHRGYNRKFGTTSIPPLQGSVW